MKPFAGAFLFLLMLVGSGITTASAADPTDSTAVTSPTPDTSTVATPAPAETTIKASTSSGRMTVILRDGTERHYERVEPGDDDTVRALRSDGTVDTIPTPDIDQITTDVRTGVSGVPPKEGGGTGFFRSATFRGAPLPEKKSFPLFQAGVLARFDDAPNQDESKLSAVLDMGWMTNVSPKVALGGTVGVASDFTYSRIALKARLRRWLGDGTALDFAPGIFVPKKGTLFDSEPDPNRGDMGFVGEVSFSAKDWFSLSYVVEVIEANRTSHIQGSSFPSETDVGHHLGMKAGGGLGLAGVGVLLIAMFAASD